MTSVSERLRSVARGLRWYLREVTGESAYDAYVTRARRAHPDCPVPSRREFERDRQDQRDVRPGQRCC
jgi:uncharacterized short protein YbdD (DUF466 family)